MTLPPPTIPAPPAYTGRLTVGGRPHKTDLANWRYQHTRRLRSRELVPGVLLTADLIPAPSAAWTLTGHLSLTVPGRWGLASTISIAVATRISAEVATDADLVALLRSDTEADLAAARALLDTIPHRGHPMTATPTTLSRLPDGRWLVTRQGVASYHPTLAAACIEAGWEGDLPAQSAPTAKPRPPEAHLLHRPASLTHQWVVDRPWMGSRSDHPDLTSALGALIKAAEEGHRPHIGPSALVQIIAETNHVISPHPPLPTLRALAAIARPAPLDPTNYLPHGRTADLSHPTEPQTP